MIIVNGKSYRELRCNNCQTFIIYEFIFAGRTAYKCPKCGILNEHSFKHLKTKANADTMEREFEVEQSNMKGGEK